tara:strand:+ start:10 stop:9552 length:9543 start_codon:yes stop_codon:yes gene_type:complete
MNKDLDERLVPNGEYRDAMNVQVATSDGSDVGSLQNIMGNLDLSSATIDPKHLANDLYVVGSITDEKTDKLYWLVSGAGVDFIAEYDYKTSDVKPIVVDIFPIGTVPGNDSGRVLNFDKRYLITGINIIEDNLFWTDNNTEPKKINITRVRIGSVDFTTHTDLYVPNPDITSSFEYVSAGPIRHEHITVAKKAPKTAPKLEMKYTTREDVDMDGIAGELETTLTLADLSGFWNQNASPPGYVSTPITVTFDSIPDFKNKDKLIIEVLSPTTQQTTKKQMVVEIDSGIPNSGIWNGTCKIQILSWDLGLDLSETDFNVRLKQSDPLFQFKFPRFAYRYKFANGEYSTFSPFSEVAFLPQKFDYLPKEGYNLGMVNAVRSLGVCDFVDERYIPDDVTSIDLLYKESNSPSVYSVKTIDRIIPDPTGIFDEWNGISPTATYNTSATPPIQTYGYVNIESEMIHAMLPANQLLRSWDNIPRKALAQEVVGNRLVYGNYLQNYNMATVYAQKPPGLYTSTGAQVLLSPSKSITVDLKLVLKNYSLGSAIPEELDAGKAHSYRSAKTIKSLRTYQVGVIYIDEFGRETPVFSNSKDKRHTLYVGEKNAPYPSKLKTQIFNAKPDWAKHFKFLIKETSNEYYNLAMDRWYPAEDGNIWLSFPSSERNKVDLETFLILKKAHDSSVAVTDGGKYKILDIDSEAPLFLKTKRSPKGQFTDGTTIAGVLPPHIGGPAGLTSAITFPFPGGRHIELRLIVGGVMETIVQKIEDDGVSDYQFRVVSIDGASKWYSMKNISEDLPGFYKLTSVKTFGADMAISSPGAGVTGYGNLTIEFVKKEIVNKPEFDGRFFVKILKDARLQEYIIGYQLGAAPQYVVSNAITSQYINPSAQSVTGNPGGPNYQGGSNWFGYDHDKLSLSKKNNDSSFNAGGAGDGAGYWRRAAKDETYTNPDDGQSSGWFIDKVEAFRSFKYTDHFFGSNPSTGGSSDNNNDPSWFTNPDSGTTFKTAMNVGPLNYNDPSPRNQLQVIGTNTSTAGGPNSYLGIGGVKAPGNVLQNATTAKHGQIIPSVGIDTVSSLIHLSYAGAGDSQGNVNVNSLTSLKTSFDEWTDYVEEINFINSITTSGNIWRWAEDPGNIVYKTLGTAPTGVSSTEWGASQTDYDGWSGVELFNYTKLSDYGVRWHHQFSGYNAFGSDNVGSTEHTAFVSQAKGDGSTYVSGFLGGIVTAATLYATAYSGLSGWYVTQLSDSLTSHPPAGVHGRWPMFTEDWSLPRNRRRRYSIHAQPLPTPAVIDANGTQILPPITGAEGLGGIGPHFYLPTNPPDNPPHYDEDYNVLSATTTPPLPAITNTPTTIAPGIRPDGMYAGIAHPQNVSYTVAGTTHSTIPSIATYQDNAANANSAVSPAAGSVTWQILDTYLEDGFEEGYFSTNPAIWETEPKEDIGLEIYHEVGQIYPTELNEKTLEQFFGPIHTDLSRNSKVTCWQPFVGWFTLQTNSGTTGDTDIRIAAADMLSGEVAIALKDINGNFLDANAVVLPPVGSRLIFTRADGSVTEVDTKSVPTSFIPLFSVESNVHNYEVTLPWFNAYSFGHKEVGNGVESNRIRDDYNQVTIDKGPKVSTVLEEPYVEERRSSGLIYSGIYNSTSGINNLNQFIQAEKITKDLNPSYGSIQKLFTRNTNLVTFCEDKVFKILANKDALYNADGNINLTSSDNVLGQTIPFVGDYGISTNPESFAADSYRAYFTDRTRGSVLRLSQDGLTPISSIGMTDWFADNLSASNRIMGNFDGRKDEYNISLSYFDFGRNEVGIKGNSKNGTAPYTPSNELITTYKVASRLRIGDLLIGIGIPAGTTVVDKINNGSGEWVIKMSQPPSSADVGPLGNPINYGTISPSGFQGFCLWSTEISIAREGDPEPQTLSFSELSKGWVSFKSFHFEDGLSLNNDYFTFKGGQLFKHHANPKHNTFYESLCGFSKVCALETFTESSVEVLFNELPGSVKSFQTLNYEGSQSKITADIDNSGEWWDNKDKLGWYVDNMYTNLQEAEPSEFKDKEGKWFSTVKGVATEWLDDGTAGNIDTNEFSYQGIDEAGALTSVGGYTSWDCEESNLQKCCAGLTLKQQFTAQTTDNHLNVVIGSGFNAGNLSTQIHNYFWNNPTQKWKGTILEIYNLNGRLIDRRTVCNSGTNGAIVYDEDYHSPNLFNWYGSKHWLGSSTPTTPSDFLTFSTADPQGGETITNVPQTGMNTPVRDIRPHIHCYQDLIDWCHENISSTKFFTGMTYAQLETAWGGYWDFTYADINFILGANQTNPDHDFAWLLGTSCMGPLGTHHCVEVPGLSGTYPTESACQADTNSPCSGTCVTPNIVIPHHTDATTANGCADGDGAVEVILSGAATSWSVVYENPNTNTVFYTDPQIYNYNGWSNPAVLPQGDYAAVVTDNLGCPPVSVTFTVGCGTGVGCPQTNPHTVNAQIIDDLYYDGQCWGNGSIELQMINLGGGAGSWTVEYFSVIAGVATSIYIDPATYFNSLVATQLTNLAEGDYRYVITDSTGCVYETNFHIECQAPMPGCQDPLATNYDFLATADCVGNIPGLAAYTAAGTYGDTSCCSYPCHDLVWDQQRSAWVTNSGTSQPLINDIFVALDNVVADDCADASTMISNAVMELNIVSMQPGVSTFTYEVIPGSNVDTYFTTSSGNANWGGFPFTVWTYNVPLTVPPATGDWEVIITDDLGNEECYTFTVDCAPPPPCTQGTGLTNIATLSGHNTLQNNNFGTGFDNIDFQIDFPNTKLVDCGWPSSAVNMNGNMGQNNYISGSDFTITIFNVHNGVTAWSYDLIYNPGPFPYLMHEGYNLTNTGTPYPASGLTPWVGAMSLTHGHLDDNDWPVATPPSSFVPRRPQTHRGNWTIILKDDLGGSVCYDFDVPCDGGSGGYGDILGCTNPAATNYDPNATIDDGSCNLSGNICAGCTDPTATNYNSNAFYDDGSCCYTGTSCDWGCTDSTATNYDPNANVDDGGCCDCASVSGTASIPDNNFENWMEKHDKNMAWATVGSAASLGNGTMSDGLVDASKVCEVTGVNLRAPLYLNPTMLSQAYVSDMTGIEHFCSLETLWADGNNFTILDVSQNVNLKVLWTYNNSNLQEINLGSQIDLTNLTLKCHNGPNLIIRVGTQERVDMANCLFQCGSSTSWSSTFNPVIDCGTTFVI